MAQRVVVVYEGVRYESAVHRGVWRSHTKPSTVESAEIPGLGVGTGHGEGRGGVSFKYGKGKLRQ